MADEIVQTGIIEAQVAPEATESAAPADLEAAPEEKPEEKKVDPVAEEDKRFAAKFAALTRREKEIRHREKLVEARLKEIESKLSQSEAAKPPAAPQESIERRLMKDPFKTLESLGVDYGTLTQMALNDGKLTPELQMKLMREEMESKYASQLSEITKKLEARDQKEEKDRQDALVNNFKSNISNTIAGSTDQYELLAAEGEYGVELVYDVIDRHYQETEEVMDIGEAASKVEDHLYEEAKKRIELPKLKKLLGTSQDKTPTELNKAPKKTSATLSNEASQVQPTTGRFLSDEESKREAAKLIKFDA